MSAAFRWSLALILVTGLIGSVSAEDEDEIAYDIYRRDNRLTVWLDLSSYLTERTVIRLRDGIDLLVEYRLMLEVPRRFFGDRRVAKQSEGYKISYRPVSEDWLLSALDVEEQQSRRFMSLASLYQFLQDSVEFDLIGLDSLDSESRYTLAIEITTVSLTDFNRLSDGRFQGESDSPLRYLFRQFLSLTGHGRSEHATKSRPFSVPEILEGP